MFWRLVTAIRTLTSLPIPGKDAEGMAGALPWFPLVGWLLGFALYWITRAFSLASGGWAEGAAGVAVAGGVLMTRGLHLDGLADWADGFSGGRDRDDTLAIMKDPQVGTFGVLAVTLVLLLKYIAILRMVSVGSLHWIVPAYVVSRTVMVELSVWLPYARPEGGTAGPFVNNARTRHRLLAPALAVILLLAFSGWAGLVLLAAGFTVCRFLGIWFHRRVGGVTGDLLGACCEIVETGLLFSCATAGHMPSPYTSWRLLPL